MYARYVAHNRVEFKNDSYGDAFAVPLYPLLSVASVASNRIQGHGHPVVSGKVSHLSGTNLVSTFKDTAEGSASKYL